MNVLKIKNKELNKSLTWIMSHPIAGSEVSGPTHGTKNLFLNKWCIVVYTGMGLLDKGEKGTFINNFLSDKYDILNSAVTSYSPSIYFKKTQYNIKNGLEFDNTLNSLNQ